MLLPGVALSASTLQLALCFANSRTTYVVQIDTLYFTNVITTQYFHLGIK